MEFLETNSKIAIEKSSTWPWLIISGIWVLENLDLKGRVLLYPAMWVTQRPKISENYCFERKLTIMQQSYFDLHNPGGRFSVLPEVLVAKTEKIHYRLITKPCLHATLFLFISLKTLTIVPVELFLMHDWITDYFTPRFELVYERLTFEIVKSR